MRKRSPFSKTEDMCQIVVSCVFLQQQKTVSGCHNDHGQRRSPIPRLRHHKLPERAGRQAEALGAEGLGLGTRWRTLRRRLQPHPKNFSGLERRHLTKTQVSTVATRFITLFGFCHVESLKQSGVYFPTYEA